MIRLHNLDRLYKDLQPALDNVSQMILKSGQVMLGEFTKEFEQRLANIAGAEHAAIVGSGSDALYYVHKSKLSNEDISYEIRERVL